MSSLADRLKQAHADVRAIYGLNHPDEEAAAKAEEGFKYLIEHAQDQTDRTVSRYNLGSLYQLLGEPELAYEQFLINIQEDPSDFISPVEAARCLLEKDSRIYDPKEAWRLLEPFERSLWAGVIKIRILAMDSDNEKNLEMIAGILYENIHRASDNRDFPDQPFPEYAAIFAWFDLVSDVIEPNFDYVELLEDALDVVEKRRKKDGWQTKDLIVRSILYDLLDEYECI